MKALREALSLAALLTPIIYLAVRWHSIPAMVPTHYSFRGDANLFAPRSSIWWLVGLSVALYLFLLLIARFSRYFNLPHALGDRRRSSDEALAVQLVAWLRLEVVALFAYIIIQTIHAASSGDPGLGRLFVPVVLLIVFLTCAFFLWRMRSAGGAAMNGS